MQPYELRRHQRPRNLPHFQVGSGESTQNVNQKDILQNKRRKVQSTPRSKEELDYGGN